MLKPPLMPLSVKRIGQLLAASGAVAIGLFAYVSYRQYTNEVLFMRRMCELECVPLSGVKMCQRTPGFSIGPLNMLLEPHQSLKIPSGESGATRHVGLTQHGWLRTKWAYHRGGRYKELNYLDREVPVEAWVDFYRRFGYYPKVDVAALNELTRTLEEGAAPSLYFMTPFRYSNGTRALWHCRTAVMDVCAQASHGSNSSMRCHSNS